ncbi:MAG: ATP-binding protein [Candidatus Sumerlaeia bacterium]
MKNPPRQSPDRKPRQPRLLAWVLFSVMMLATFTLWQRSIEFMNDRLKGVADENSRIAIDRVTSFFEHRLELLRRVSQFCLQTEEIGAVAAEGQPDPRVRPFEGFCEELMDEIPGFWVVIRTDRDGLPQWIAPHGRLPMETANLIAADPVLTRLIRQAGNNNNPFVTEPINLIGRGDGFVIGVPIVRGHRTIGFVIGALPYDGLFDSLMQPRMLRDFHVRIMHGARPVYPLVEAPAGRWGSKDVYVPADDFTQLPFFMGGWMVKVEPTTATHVSPLNPVSLAVLSIGILVSIGIGYGVFRWMRRAAQLQIEARESRSSLEHTGMSLIEVRSQLEQIINSVEEGIVIYDAGRKPILANMAFLTMFNPGDDARLMNDASAHHEYMIQAAGSETRYWSLFEALRRWPEQQYTDEISIAVDTRRRPRAYTRRAMTATDAAGEQRGIIVVYKDVTRDKAIDRAKDEFLANVTHELRSPLSSIKGFAEMMRRDPGMAVERRAEFVSIICEEAERLQQLVEELLDLRRLEDQGLTLNPTTFDLKALIEELVAGARAILVSKNLTMKVEWDGSNDHRMQGDVVQLRRAIRNLLVNSAKYSPEAGRIVIVGHSGRERLTVDVHDQGSGIDERDLPHIFDKFYRGRRQGRQKGTGLGLAIVKHIVERHGGHIGVRSEMGEGTTFRIELPRRMEAMESAEQARG